MTITQPIDLESRMNFKGTAFPLADANGNAVTYLDDAGNVQAHYVYNALGGTVSHSGDMDDDFLFRFSSKYLDAETSMYYYGFRYYDTETGRWLNRDPIWERGGLMLYGFVANNGVNKWDKLGLVPLNLCTGKSFTTALPEGNFSPPDTSDGFGFHEAAWWYYLDRSNRGVDEISIPLNTVDPGWGLEDFGIDPCTYNDGINSRFFLLASETPLYHT